jgi:hypothetical protein
MTATANALAAKQPKVAAAIDLESAFAIVVRLFIIQASGDNKRVRTITCPARQMLADAGKLVAIGRVRIGITIPASPDKSCHALVSQQLTWKTRSVRAAIGCSQGSNGDESNAECRKSVP